MTERNTERQMTDELIEAIRRYIPKLKLKFKDQSRFWKCLPAKLRESSTTFPSTIWLNTKKRYDEPDKYLFETIAHECKHAMDMARGGFLFWLAYLLPQILALGGVLWLIAYFAFGLSAWNLIPGIALLGALAPWPSPTRAGREIRGYSMNMLIKKARTGEVPTEKRMYIVGYLTGWLYYKMVWRRSAAIEMVDDAERSVGRGTEWCMVTNNVLKILERHGQKKEGWVSGARKGG